MCQNAHAARMPLPLTCNVMGRLIPIVIQIKRGAQQGDPMLCLVYDLAIELLACREAKEDRVPGIKKLITKLFADDMADNVSVSKQK